MTTSAGSFWVFEETEPGRMIHITLEKTVIGHDSWPSPLEPQPAPPADATVTHRTFFDMAVDGEPIGRLAFGLFGNALPKTVENFRALCAGDKVCCQRDLRITVMSTADCACFCPDCIASQTPKPQYGSHSHG